jgi:hypothetical protein
MGVGAWSWAGLALVAVAACGAARRSSSPVLDSGSGPEAAVGPGPSPAGADAPVATPDARSSEDAPATADAPPAPADAMTASPTLPPVEVVRYGKPADQADFDNLVRQGYRLVWQDGFQLNGAVFFNSIFRLEPDGPAWRALIDLDGDDFRTELAALSRDGFRPRQVDSYLTAAGPRYAILAEKSPGPEFVVYHARNVDEHQRLFEERNAAGWSPFNIAVTEVAGAPSVTSLYENWDVGGHYSWRELTLAEFEARNRLHTADGLRLVYAKVYTLAGTVHVSAIWHFDAPRSVIFRPALSAEQLGAELELQRRAGLRTRAISGYVDQGQSRFFAIWSE